MQVGAAAAPSRPRKMRAFRGGLFHRFLSVPPSGELYDTLVSPGQDELKLKRELSDICHKVGVPDWQQLVKVIWDWIAEVNGSMRTYRLNVLEDLIKEIRAQAMRFEQLRSSKAQAQMDEVRQKIHGLLKTFADGLPVRR